MLQYCIPLTQLTQPSNFTRITRKPTIVHLIPKGGGVYCIKNDKTKQTNILLDLGKTLEKMLTLEPHQFEKLLKVNKPDAHTTAEEYNYLKVGDCLLRAQLDCYDPQLHKIFDVKSRAISSIRYNLDTYKQYREESISKLTGGIRSFEYEFYDMLRSSFLRYNYQVRIY